MIGKWEVEEAIQRVGLDPADKRVFGKYSMGMKQSLVIAQTIMEKPDVIMLDEPTNGLDEAGIKEIRQLIEQEKERGALILLASHNQEDMKILADQVHNQVCENEFFATTQKGMDALVGLKNEMIEKYNEK